MLFMVLIVLGTLGTQTSFAAKEGSAAAKPEYVKKLNKIVKESIKYPDFTLNKEEFGDITVTFTLTDEGKITVEKITAPSKRIEEYVKEQLSNVNANGIGHPYGMKYAVKFHFRFDVV